MKTVAGYAVSMSAQKFVAPWRAVAANNIDLHIRIPQRCRQIVEQVEHPRIVVTNVARAVVAQITVQARQGFLIISFAVAVNDIQPLSSMRMEKMQLVWTARNRLEI